MFKPCLAVNAAKHGKKESSPALGRGLGGGVFAPHYDSAKSAPFTKM